MATRQAPSASLEQALERIIALELKASDMEDTLDHLNMTIYRQQQHIDALLAEVSRLRQQAPHDGGGSVRNPRDELPPHY